MFFAWKKPVNRRVQLQIADVVSHLDVDSLSVRQLALESLATIMDEHPQFQGEILNIIAKYIRDRQSLILPSDFTQIRELGNLPSATIGDDVQTGLMVIGRSNQTQDTENTQASEIIDLSHINLAGVNLDFGNFVRVNFDQTNLTGASLRHTNLQGAILSAANLSFGNLEYANLAHANLGAANLTKTNLQNADLTAANLFLAKLRHTDLRRAILTQANLNGVDIQQAIIHDREFCIPETDH